MSRHQYTWNNGPAEIQQHSVTKLQVLRQYIIQYCRVLGNLPQRDELKFTLVDGFAGGGLYLHVDSQQEIDGSPLVCLQAVREAEFQINQNRTKNLTLDVDYFFVEKDKTTYNYLYKTLNSRGYNPKTNNKIHMCNSSFESKCQNIIDFIKKKNPHSGRAIFILDQYGYSEVPTTIIRKIFEHLKNAEVILTFNIDSFINYASDSKNTINLLKKIGISLPDVFTSFTLEELKKSDKNWRFFIQSVLYDQLVTSCGADYYTPFFIRNPGGHGDYWLIHMSRHYRARDVMTSIHWKHQNNFIHYGDAGLYMFNLVGYDPSRDDNFSGQSALGFEFDDVAKSASIKQLSEQLPKVISIHRDGLSFQALVEKTCNYSPASSEIYCETLNNLHNAKEIMIVNSNGNPRRSAHNIKREDIIIVPRQPTLFSFR